MHLGARKQNDSGFTLVELAIVLMIVGLMIGGVLKGAEMIEKSKITNTIAQVRMYQTGWNNFNRIFDGKPGDLPRAQQRIPNCSNANFCLDYDARENTGDNRVGNYNPWIMHGGTVASVSQGTIMDRGLNYFPSRTPTSQIDNNGYETTLAWKHLVLARMITGVQSDYDVHSRQPAWGVSHPGSALGGGFEVFYDNDITGPDDWGAMSFPDGIDPNWDGISGHFIRLSNLGLMNTDNVGLAGQGTVSPHRAWEIDQKIDDGIGSTGYVLGAGDNCLDAALAIPDYISGSQAKNCVLFFNIEGE